MNKTDFLLEEYKQNWEYIRQCEDVRLKHTQLFFLIVAAFLSFFAFLIQGEASDKLLIDVMSRIKILIVSALIFLSIYSTMVSAFILFQKRGYESYRNENLKIKAFFTQIEFNESERSIWKEFSLTSPFTWWFGSIAIICILLWSALVAISIYI